MHRRADTSHPTGYLCQQFYVASICIELIKENEKKIAWCSNIKFNLFRKFIQVVCYLNVEVWIEVIFFSTIMNFDFRTTTSKFYVNL